MHRHWYLLSAAAIGVAACSTKAKDAPGPIAAPAAPRATDDAANLTPCESFLERSSELSGYAGAPGPADLAYCESLTAEQVTCGIAAASTDELSSCLHFPDPERRAVGRRLATSVRRDWPGTQTIAEVTVQGALGCAFAGLLGADEVPLTETAVLAAFALRDVRAGDPADILAWLARETPDDAWRCTRTDPPDLCPRLLDDCAAGAADR